MAETIDPGFLPYAAGLLVLAVLAGAGLAALLFRKNKGDDGVAAAIAELSRANAELQGRLTQIANDQQSGRTELQKSMNERLDAVTKRVGDSLGEQTQRTAQSLQTLNERLALIDAAQKNISELSGEVTGLKQILSNKQARGAFGEVQLKDVIESLLPPSAFDFQHTLSTGKRPDALIILPQPPGPIAVDAKFPLEAYRNLVGATDEATKLSASRAFTADVKKHLDAIAGKYLIPGETADTALMFVPSEAVYATIHADFPDLVDHGRARKVLVVSPTTLMAILNTVRAVLRDAEMHKQAHLIQAEVGKMVDDVRRLDDRVDKLQRHFDMAVRDVSDIRISTGKIIAKGEKIAEVDLEDETPGKALPGA
ncbi:DNA recombination protein RmuC [Hyphobacterium sp. HN65]|uniref:DNA recombination protein RmuC homolog n=1 Tax=Hyphobacterium lacteum TaxID=3116575 RepID=A0ABU7LNJ0_9PROT|nr:DNA recombination protein RmuC [Hyphobacterium sp. HN65]MEE2525491.1 DNA recombination protein RmuC [Hyphobacterium sp. HN65]